MASRHSIASLTRTAASPSAVPSGAAASLRLRTTHQQAQPQRRLLHQPANRPHHHALLSAAVFNTAARRRGQAQGLTATFGLQSPARAAAAASKISARAYSTEKEAADAPPSPSKFWDFEAVSKLIQDSKHKIAIIDVREPKELRETGWIPGAVNIPITTSPDSFHITDEEFEDRFGYPRPARDAEILLYCRAGVRGRAAAGLAKDAGWTDVGEYPGSWLDWAEKGGKVQHS